MYSFIIFFSFGLFWKSKKYLGLSSLEAEGNINHIHQVLFSETETMKETQKKKKTGPLMRNVFTYSSPRQRSSSSGSSFIFHFSFCDRQRQEHRGGFRERCLFDDRKAKKTTKMLLRTIPIQRRWNHRLSTDHSRNRMHDNKIYRKTLYSDNDCAHFLSSFCDRQYNQNSTSVTITPLAKKHIYGVVASLMSEYSQIKSTFPGVLGEKSYLVLLRFMARANSAVIESVWEDMIKDGITPTVAHYRIRSSTYKLSLSRYLSVWKEALDHGFCCPIMALVGARLLIRNDMFEYATRVRELIEQEPHEPGEATRAVSELKVITSSTPKEAENALKGFKFISGRQLNSYLAVCKRVNNPQAAEAFIAKKCAIMQPINESHRTTLMTIHAASGNVKDFESHFRKMMHPDQQSHNRLMQCYSECGDLDSARKVFVSMCCMYQSLDFHTYVDSTRVAARHSSTSFYDEIMTHAGQHHTKEFLTSLTYMCEPRPS
eukprot:TRINITY_DN2195_c2_g1_i3.p1 TRINITY_DN2195_c2_g1~~TRINITY_DN2195_c2_g1_i3.p1  ORF type:complete len:487 (+),score=25.07 TRINITY_DN2195_c2_g1_i3:905-2365(+)